jgi:hypothetical protein
MRRTRVAGKVAARSLGVLVCLSGLLSCSSAQARSVDGPKAAEATALQPAESGPSPGGRQGSERSPSGPPLVSGRNGYATPSSGTAGGREPGEGGEPETEAGHSGGEPLVENGLSSPLCAKAGTSLSDAAGSDCETSGFVASAAPAEDYGFDVHIESGLKESVMGYFQTVLIKPPWAMFVWCVQSLLVGIEWSYTLDLLGSPQMRNVATALGRLERTFTKPLLVLALSIAAVALAWRGIVKRQSAASVGEAFAILAMIAGGLLMVLDPLGTVGSLARWSDGASIQTLGTVVSGSPANPDRTLAQSTTQLFDATILGPWCFMEFGNVAWCDEARHLDPQLRRAAVKLAARDEAEAGKSGGQRASGLDRSARLLRSARTNGAIFLALPANGPGRNSIKHESSLLYAICRSPNVANCRGPAASEAEFRTSGFTIERFIGLTMIWAGGVGMILLLGFVLIRLLGAAILSLLLFLIAPAAVLMPALGESGRRSFRLWLGRLLAAVLAKLLWSFLLGTVLVSLKILLLLGGFGWWIQWLLTSVLWWGAFHYRHRLLGLAAESRWSASGRRGPIAGAFARSRAALTRSRRRWRGDEPKPATLDGARPAGERDRNEAIDLALRHVAAQMSRRPGGRKSARSETEACEKEVCREQSTLDAATRRGEKAKEEADAATGDAAAKDAKSPAKRTVAAKRSRTSVETADPAQT